jgi:hypothetical protein
MKNTSWKAKLYTVKAICVQVVEIYPPRKYGIGYNNHIYFLDET